MFTDQTGGGGETSVAAPSIGGSAVTEPETVILRRAASTNAARIGAGTLSRREARTGALSPGFEADRGSRDIEATLPEVRAEVLTVPLASYRRASRMTHLPYHSVVPT